MPKTVVNAVRRAISQRMKKLLEKAAVGKVERMEMDWQPEEKQVSGGWNSYLQGRRVGGIHSACNVDADGGGGCGSLDDTRLVGKLRDSRLCSSMLGEGIRVRATALSYWSASWTRPSTWLSEAREKRCTSSMPDRVVSSDNFYHQKFLLSKSF